MHPLLTVTSILVFVTRHLDCALTYSLGLSISDPETVLHNAPHPRQQPDITVLNGCAYTHYAPSTREVDPGHQRDLSARVMEGGV